MIFLQDRSFEEYITYLNENRDSIRELLYLPENSPARTTFDRVFKDNFVNLDRSSGATLKVAATDSSEFIRELYNGKKIILSRAFTKYGNRTESRFISRVMSVDREDMGTFMGMLMEHLEHLSVKDFLDEGSDSNVVLIDGSITGRLAHSEKPLRAEGFENFHSEYFKGMNEMVEASDKAGIPLVFVAKSSETTIFRRHLSGILKRDVREDRKITDHLLVKSLAVSPGYTVPVKEEYSAGIEDRKITVSTFHLIPDLTDVPLKVDYVHPTSGRESKVPEDIIKMLFYGYTGYKVYNLWLSDVDNAVKFRKQEVENIYMKEFERHTGIQFYETRGERRVRTRV